MQSTAQSPVLLPTLPESPSLEPVMAPPRAIMETTAEDHVGFPTHLWRVVHDVLGSQALPVYVVFERAPSPVGSAFRADEQISPCPRGTKQPYRIGGKAMPTLDQAIQIAAWEGLARLHSSEALMAESRAFRFFPSKPSGEAEVTNRMPARDSDSAIPNLIAYGSAMTILNNSLMVEHSKTKGKLARARVQLQVNPSLSSPSQPRTQAAGLHPIFFEASQQSYVSNPPPLTQQAPNTLSAVQGALARVRQHLRADVIARGIIPMNPIPEEEDRKSTRLNSSHSGESRMPSSA